MESAVGVTLLYETLDSLVAVKLDLIVAERRGSGLPPERQRRMCGDIDASIRNVRSVIETLERNRARFARAGVALSPQLTAKQ